MVNHRLSLGTDGDLWLVADDGPDCHARCLGEPREGLYDELPVELWPELTKHLDERTRSQDFRAHTTLGDDGNYYISHEYARDPLRGGRIPEGAVPCEGDCADCLRGGPCDECSTSIETRQ